MALGAWLLALLMTFGVTWWAESTLSTPGERLLDGLVLAAPQLLLGVLLIRARPWAQGLVGVQGGEDLVESVSAGPAHGRPGQTERSDAGDHDAAGVDDQRTVGGDDVREHHRQR